MTASPAETRSVTSGSRVSVQPAKPALPRASLRSCGAQLVGCLRGPSILFIIVHKEEKNCKCEVAILNLSNIFFIYSSEIFYILKICHGGKFYKN